MLKKLVAVLDSYFNTNFMLFFSQKYIFMIFLEVSQGTDCNLRIFGVGQQGHEDEPPPLTPNFK